MHKGLAILIADTSFSKYRACTIPAIRKTEITDGSFYDDENDGNDDIEELAA